MCLCSCILSNANCYAASVRGTYQTADSAEADTINTRAAEIPDAEDIISQHNDERDVTKIIIIKFHTS